MSFDGRILFLLFFIVLIVWIFTLVIRFMENPKNNPFGDHFDD